MSPVDAYLNKAERDDVFTNTMNAMLEDKEKDEADKTPNEAMPPKKGKDPNEASAPKKGKEPNEASAPKKGKEPNEARASNENKEPDETRGPDEGKRHGRSTDYDEFKEPDGSREYDEAGEPDEASEPGGVYQPQGPLTFEKVWQMFQETDRKFQETDKMFKDTDKKFQEDFQKTRDEIRETGRIVREISRTTGGLGNNVGEVAEAYFRGALGSLPEVAGVRIKMTDSLLREKGGLRGQFDIVLFGDRANVVVEVKHKLQVKDVTRFHKRTLPLFKQLYPEHCRKKVFGAVAGMCVDDAALSQALDLGFLVFTQSGQEIRVLNPSGFEPREF